MFGYGRLMGWWRRVWSVCERWASVSVFSHFMRLLAWPRKLVIRIMLLKGVIGPIGFKHRTRLMVACWWWSSRVAIVKYRRFVEILGMLDPYFRNGLGSLPSECWIAL